MDVQMIGDNGFVWSLEDAMTLRKEYRIIGCFVGYSPRSLEIGLPLMLMKEEVQLLKEKGIVKLVDCDIFLKDPSENLKER